MVNSTKIVPAALPPDGVVANFESPQDGYYMLFFVVLIISTVLTNIFFLIHAYVKLVVKSARLLQEDCESTTIASCICQWSCSLTATHSRVLFGSMGMW